MFSPARPSRWLRPIAIALVVMATGGAATAAAPHAAPTRHGAASFQAGRITARALWQRIEAGERLTLVDVRPVDAYTDLHVSGAIAVPWARLPVLQRTLPRDRTIVLYCT